MCCEYPRLEEISRVPEKLSCKAILWKSPTVLQVLVPSIPALIQVASVIDEMHRDCIQKQLDFRELLQA